MASKGKVAKQTAAAPSPVSIAGCMDCKAPVYAGQGNFRATKDGVDNFICKGCGTPEGIKALRRADYIVVEI